MVSATAVTRSTLGQAGRGHGGCTTSLIMTNEPDTSTPAPEATPAPTVAPDPGQAEPQRERVLFACSAGGHLAQLLQLRSWYSQHDRRWVTFELPDAVSLLGEESVVWGHYPTTRNLPNLVRNTWLAVREIRRMRPTVIVSSGAAIAVPFFWVGKMFRAKTVYVEVIDRIDTRTMTARLVSPVTDLIVAQDESQRALFPGCHVIGQLL